MRPSLMKKKLMMKKSMKKKLMKKKLMKKKSRKKKVRKKKLRKKKLRKKKLRKKKLRKKKLRKKRLKLWKQEPKLGEEPTQADCQKPSYKTQLVYFQLNYLTYSHRVFSLDVIVIVILSLHHI
jgi:hypothetical protein